jgi:hypoxanthine-DNA glycosylase
MHIGFEPVFDKNSKILILGSFPSVKSRDINFYYGHKQNKFWKLLSEIYKKNLNTIDEKKEFLLKNNIALWDIVEECEIKGSSDSSIIVKKVVDLQIILDKANIQKIICNGKKAYEIYKKYYENLPIESICLPSTSPANAIFKKELWINELSRETK